MAKLQAPSGFRDFLPQQQRRRAELMRRIREVYESFGFEPMETPAMENLAVFLGKGGGENEKLMFRVLKRGAELQRALEKHDELADMALRFDLTVPLARYYATNRTDLAAVFKRYQIGPVWRAESPQRGRFREFIQCDVDVLGSSSMMVETEVIIATTTALERLGFRGLTVRLNARPLLHGLISTVGIPNELVGGAITSIDKMDKTVAEKVTEEMLGRGISAESIGALYDFQRRTEGLNSHDLLVACEQFIGHTVHASLAGLREIIEMVGELPHSKLVLDPFLARGMDYYTGPVFEVAAEDVPFSLAGGGRFDELIGKLSGQNVPACGFSIGFERVFTLMEERNMFDAASRAADVLVAVPNPQAGALALRLGAELRARGVSADVYPGSAKLVAQYELAEKKGIPYAVLAEDAQTLQVRDLATRQMESVARAGLHQWLQARLHKGLITAPLQTPV